MSDAILLAVVLLNLSLLGGRRLKGCIARTALLGLMTSLFGVAAHGRDVSPRLLVLAGMMILTKAVVFPWLLTRAMRATEVTKERRPFVGMTGSMVLGIMLVGAGFLLGRAFVGVGEVSARLAMPVSFATLLSGLLMIIARRTVLFQAIGYLVMENGIYIAGVALVSGMPFLLEFGVLLDVLAGILVMSMAARQIDRETNSVTTDTLNELKG